MLLEAELYLSVLSLFGDSQVKDESARIHVERTAFNILGDLCTVSREGRAAVSSASSFKDAFGRAMELASPRANEIRSDGCEGNVAGEDGSTGSVEENQIDSLIEAAYDFISAMALGKSTQEILACHPSFVKSCFSCARTGSNTIIRRSATTVVARLCRSHVDTSAFTVEEAGQLFRQALVDHHHFQGDEFSRKSVEIVAAEGLLRIFDKLSDAEERSTVEDVSKVYLSVVRQRSLSKASKAPGDRKIAAELAYCLVRILVMGLRCNDADSFFGYCAIAPLVGTVQWRYDSKTIFDADEGIYWDAAACHAMQILSLWLEQGNPCVKEERSNQGTARFLMRHVWMVAGPGKAPRKSIDFVSALQVASERGEASSRLSADGLRSWLDDNQ